MEEFSDGGSTPPASTKKDGHPTRGGRLFLRGGSRSLRGHSPLRKMIRGIVF